MYRIYSKQMQMHYSLLIAPPLLASNSNASAWLYVFVSPFWFYVVMERRN